MHIFNRKSQLYKFENFHFISGKYAEIGIYRPTKRLHPQNPGGNPPPGEEILYESSFLRNFQKTMLRSEHQYTYAVF